MVKTTSGRATGLSDTRLFANICHESPWGGPNAPVEAPECIDRDAAAAPKAPWRERPIPTFRARARALNSGPTKRDTLIPLVSWT